MLNEAALETVRRRGEQVSTADIYNGMDRILQVLAALWPLTHAARADLAGSEWPGQEPPLRLHSLLSFNAIWLCRAKVARGLPQRPHIHADTYTAEHVLQYSSRQAGNNIFGSNRVAWQSGSGSQGMLSMTSLKRMPTLTSAAPAFPRLQLSRFENELWVLCRA